MDNAIEIIARTEDGKVHTVMVENGALYAERPLAEPLWLALEAATHPSWRIVDHVRGTVR